MKELFEALRAALAEKKATTLVTIIDSAGSTPRKKGTRMLMSTTKHLAGTVGGGTVEFRAEELGKKIAQTGVNTIETFNLGPNEAADLGMICGGKVTMLFQYLSDNTPYLTEIVAEILMHLKNNQTFWLWSALDLDNSLPFLFYSIESGWIGTSEHKILTEQLPEQTGEVTVNAAIYFVEKLADAGRVYIFGGGHVAQALVPVLSTLGFYCVIVDDRPEFLTETYFPTAQERVVVDLSAIEQAVMLTHNDYGIVMTRGHLSDTAVEMQVLAMQPYYLGVMGSKHKVAVQIEKLKAAGFSQETINKIKMPIGLDIQAQTPAELAISVAGELIEARAQKK